MHKTEKFPISNVVGFILSIALTVLAFIFAEKTSFENKTIMTFLTILAFGQAGLQLFMFMHMTEGKEGLAKVVHTIYAIIMALIVVIGTYFVMTMGHPIH